MKTILITGSSGFIGYHLVKEFVKDYKLICLVRPNSKSIKRLDEFKDRITVIEHDIRDNCDRLLDHCKDVNIILHAGGNPSSLDSIQNPSSVIYDNIIGTTNLLDLSRKLELDRFFYYSAGEVFGPISKGQDSGENDQYNSVSPYAASKAGGEEICIAYSNTFGVPVSITHITNTFGPMSQSNRFPVFVIKRLLADESIDIHIGKDSSISGRRWLHANDVALHTKFILENQKSLCEKWNSAGSRFIDNLEFAQMIASTLNKKLKYNLVENNRAGNEPYFSLSPAKLFRLGWQEPLSIEDRLTETVSWYTKNQSWLNNI